MGTWRSRTMVSSAMGRRPGWSGAAEPSTGCACRASTASRCFAPSSTESAAGHSRSGRRASRGLIIPIGRWVLGQSFVRQISSEEVDATIVTVMISMARSLRLRVVAEGIETA